MGRKGGNVSSDTKLKYAKLCYEGKMSKSAAAKELSVARSSVSMWVYIYQEQGTLGFLNTGKNHVYSEELRLEAVMSYLEGKGSLDEIAARYGVSSRERIRQWVKMYNSGKDFSLKMSGGSRMKTSRNTTKEERIQIVKECIANGCIYGESAIKHNVSYQQVYGWV